MEVINSELDGAQATVTLTVDNSALTRFSNNIIHQNVARRSYHLSIMVVKDKRVGKADTNIINMESIIETVRNALKITEFTPVDEEHLDLLEQQSYKPVDRYCEATAEMTPEDRADIVYNAVQLCKKHNFETAGIVENASSFFMLGNSKGLYASHMESSIDYNISVYDSEGNSGWARGCSYTKNNVNFSAITKDAVAKTIMSRNPIDLPEGEYTVILEPAAVADLLMYLAFEGFGAQLFLDGRSSLCGKMNTQIAAKDINIYDDVYAENMMGMPFDFEGYPRKKVLLVENGIAKNLVHDRKTAIKSDSVSTGHALPEPNSFGPIPLNLVVAPGEKSFKEIVTTAKKAILVTHFHYINLVDPSQLILTGMTRDGLYLVEDGKISCPVKNFRFTESVFKALKNVTEIAKDQVLTYEYGLGCLTPAMKIENFRFSSKTEF